MRCVPAALLTCHVVAGCADDALTAPGAGAIAATSDVGAAGPVVMTRDLYLGADLEPLIGATSPQQVPLLAALPPGLSR